MWWEILLILIVPVIALVVIIETHSDRIKMRRLLKGKRKKVTLPTIPTIGGETILKYPPLKIIRSYCHRCTNNDEEIEFCPEKTCHLWKFRNL